MQSCCWQLPAVSCGGQGSRQGHGGFEPREDGTIVHHLSVAEGDMAAIGKQAGSQKLFVW